MAIQVRETSAGKAISAWVVLNKKGVHVATVNAHYSNGGRVSVDVWNLGDKATWNCYAAARRAGVLSEKQWQKALDAAPAHYVEQASREAWAASELFGLQQSSASGHGYDKLTAALAGIWIDGKQLANHCGHAADAEKEHAALLKRYAKNHATHDRAYWHKEADKIGADFGNFASEAGRYTSLYVTAGLERLKRLGYRAIQAI